MNYPTNFHSLSASIAAACGEEQDLLHMTLKSGEPVVFWPSSYQENAWELVGDTVFNWTIQDCRDFFAQMISCGKDFLVNGIDGMTSSLEFSKVGLAEDSNIVDTRSENWQDWMKLRTSKHRKNITASLAVLDDFEVEVSNVMPDEFDRILTAQADYLMETFWSDYGEPHGDTLRRRYPHIIRAFCEAGYAMRYVTASKEGRLLGCLISATFGSRKLLLITLLDYKDERSRGLGSSLLSFEMKASVENKEVLMFDLMLGRNHYKRLYEPDASISPSYQVAVFKEVPGYDSSIMLDSIPMPPFVAGGRLYTLQSSDLFNDSKEN